MKTTKVYADIAKAIYAVHEGENVLGHKIAAAFNGIDDIDTIADNISAAWREFKATLKDSKRVQHTRILAAGVYEAGRDRNECRAILLRHVSKGQAAKLIFAVYDGVSTSRYNKKGKGGKRKKTTATVADAKNISVAFLVGNADAIADAIQALSVRKGKAAKAAFQTIASAIAK